MTVCVPQQAAVVYNRSTEWWYESGPKAYPNSWVPLGMNLAQGRAATESSLYTGETPHGDAWRAVDGNTNGDYGQGSVSSTNYDQYAWWQVDLGGVQSIDAVELWKRTGCSACDGRLANFYVFVTEDEDFPAADGNDPNKLKDDPTVWNQFFTQTVTQTTTIPVGKYGRVVRIQLAGTNFLHLAEVKVFGMPGDPNQWPASKPAGTIGSTSGFTLTWPAQANAAQQKVDGTLYEVWPDNIGLGIAPGTDDVPFSMGTNNDERDVTASGTADVYKLGLEIKYKGDVSKSFSEEQSNIATWESDVTFEGNANGIEDECAPMEMTYQFHPYVWLQKTTSAGGVPQKFLVLDYWTTHDTATDTCEKRNGSTPPDDIRPVAVGAAVVPAAPVIASATQPDPATWYPSNKATFNWAQPPW